MTIAASTYTERVSVTTRRFSEVSIDPLRDYLQRIGRTRLLTAEEEVELAQRIEVGVLAGQRLATRTDLSGKEKRELQFLESDGARAYDRFVHANLRLVV